MRNHSSYGIFISKKKRGVKIDNNSMFAEYPDVLSIEQYRQKVHHTKSKCYKLYSWQYLKALQQET